MLRHQVGQRCLHQATAPVVNRRAIRRPLELQADGLHAGLR
jgi:hypothetical protein